MGILVKWLFLALLPLALAQDYCSVCSDHTMCRFKGKSATCGGNSESGVSPAEAVKIVDLHNAYRAQIANGRENRGKSGPQPPAANMQALAWDDNLAEVAQRWADQCTFQHDGCRHDPRFQVGQNIYWSSGFSAVNWTRAIGAWYNEVKDFDGQSVSNFVLDQFTGHYTQLAWATTTLVGCARTTYGEASRVQGYRPREFVLSASPSKPETTDEKKIGNRRVKKQYNLGFFGGVNFNPSGAMGAITGTSGGDSGSSGANQPSIPPSGNFPPNGNDGFDSVNSAYLPIFSIIGNRPNYPGDDYRPNYPSYPVYPSFPNFPEWSVDASNGGYDYPSSEENYPGEYYSHIPAGFSPHFPIRSEINGFANTPEALGLFDGETEEGLPSRRVETRPEELHLPIYAEWKNERANGKSSISAQRGRIFSQESFGNERIPANHDFVGRDQILICNYGAAGNYHGKPIYIEGAACSNCPLGTTCQNGLCAAS